MLGYYNACLSFDTISGMVEVLEDAMEVQEVEVDITDRLEYKTEVIEVARIEKMKEDIGEMRTEDTARGEKTGI